MGESLHQLVGEAAGRVIVATFASNIGRVQQVLDAAAAHGRKMVALGRSMEQNIAIALELGYLDPRATRWPARTSCSASPRIELVVMTTGSQGEPMSGLTRMSNRDHRNITIEPGDTVIVSASPIPGNEEAVARTIDNLFKEGAMVHYEPLKHCHVSGHGSREELKLMLGLVKPRHFIPVHGEYRMLVQHGLLAEGAGVPIDGIFVLENGQVVEFDGSRARLAGSCRPATCWSTASPAIDGIDGVVLRDRRCPRLGWRGDGGPHRGPCQPAGRCPAPTWWAAASSRSGRPDHGGGLRPPGRGAAPAGRRTPMTAESGFLKAKIRDTLARDSSSSAPSAAP